MANAVVTDPTINNNFSTNPSSVKPVHIIGGNHPIGEEAEFKDKELPLGYNENIFAKLKSKLDEEEKSQQNEDFFAKTAAELFNNHNTEKTQTFSSSRETATPIQEGSLSFRSVNTVSAVEQAVQIAENAWNNTSEQPQELQGINVLDQATSVASEAWNKSFNFAVDTAKETVTDVTDLFSQDLLGLTPKKSDQKAYQEAFENGELPSEQQAEAEAQQQAQHEKQWYNQLEQATNQAIAQEQQQAEADARRISEGELGAAEVAMATGYSIDFSGKPAKKVGINQAMAIWQAKQDQMKAQQQQAESASMQGGEINYFQQLNMAGERSGGQHILNAAG